MVKQIKKSRLKKKFDFIAHKRKAPQSVNVWLKYAAVARGILARFWILILANTLTLPNQYRPSKRYWWQVSDNSTNKYVMVHSMLQLLNEIKQKFTVTTWFSTVLKSLWRRFHYVTNRWRLSGVWSAHRVTLNFWIVLSAWVAHSIFAYYSVSTHFYALKILIDK